MFQDAFDRNAGDGIEVDYDWTKTAANLTSQILIATGGNTARVASDSGSAGWYEAPDQGEDLYAEIKVIDAQGGVEDTFFAIRIVDTDNFVAYTESGTGGGGTRWVKVIAGVETVLHQGAQSVGSTYRIEAVGDQYKYYIDDVQTGSTETIDDSDISTSEQSHGILTLAADGIFGEKWDDWESGPVLAVPQRYRRHIGFRYG